MKTLKAKTNKSIRDKANKSNWDNTDEANLFKANLLCQIRQKHNEIQNHFTPIINKYVKSLSTYTSSFGELTFVHDVVLEKRVANGKIDMGMDYDCIQLIYFTGELDEPCMKYLTAYDFDI